MAATSPVKYLLVDGHSVLFQISSLAAVHRQTPARARELLAQRLQQLHDTSDWLVTLVFDGTRGASQPAEPGKIAVIYSHQDATADSIIERIVAAHAAPSSITVVTADRLEQHTVEALGALALSPDWLIRELDAAEEEFKQALSDVRKKSRW